MALPTFIPGYLTEITVDTVDYTITGNVLGFKATKTTPRKPTFGVKAQAVISGQQVWQTSFSGHVSAEGPIASLLASFDKDVPLAFSIQVGELGGVTDAGIISGTLILSGLNVTVDAEGEWDYSAQAAINGAPVHTPPV